MNKIKIHGKIFDNFEKDYSSKTSFYVMTSSSIFKEENILDKSVFFIPTWFISKIINQKLNKK